MMELTELYIRCLFTAAKSREMIKREWLLDAMTVVNEHSHNLTTNGQIEIHPNTIVEFPGAEPVAKVGQVVCIDKKFLGIVLNDVAMTLTVGVLVRVGTPIFHRLDVFEFSTQMARSFFGDTPFSNTVLDKKTTVGRFIENVIMLQYPTDFKTFKYLNEVMKFKKITKLVTNAMLQQKTVTVEQYRKFMDNLYYLNHFSELCVPGLSPKSLTTDPRVNEAKKEFIEKHKDQMHDPFVIKQLEDELVKMDIAYLGNDTSKTFFDGLGEKAYKLYRKKLLLMVGGIPAFDESSGKYDFNPNSLMDGWTIEALPSIANEIRKGSYARGRETAKGGAETKLVYRVFRDLIIDTDDCGTKRTIRADFSKTFRIEDFIGRMINVNGTDVVLTPENIDKYRGKVVQLYSPLTCERKNNALCYKCCGQKIKEINVKLIGVQTIKITSQFMQTAMKAMHGTVMKTVQSKLEDILL